MKMMRWGLALIATGVMSIGSTYASDGGPLVDALVKKGVLSSQEGEEVRMEMQEAYMSTGGGMLKWGNSSVRGVKIYGDVRLRYQWEKRNSFGVSGGSDRERGRFRYRLRAGADYQFTDNFKAGIRFSTGADANSTNATTASFLDKNDPLYVDLYYLIYSSDDLFNSGVLDSFEWGAGKFKQPFMIGKDLWDGDINPEGTYVSLGFDDVAGVDVVLHGGALILDGEFRQSNGTGTDEAHDFLFVGQSELSYQWAKKSGITIAPSIWIATEGENDRASTGLTKEMTGTTGFGDFGVFLLPAEVKFKAFGYPQKFHATYGINFLADDGTDGNVGGTGLFGTNNQLVTAGYQFGKAKKKGTWQLGVDYRYIESSAWSDRIADSDFFADSGTNVHGVVVGGKVAFTDFLYGGVKYFKTWNISDAGAGVDSNDLVQVDLNWKF